MFYPKYLEFADGGLLIFDASRTHSVMAMQSEQRVVSAGTVGASLAEESGGRCGKFFGESVSLRLPSNSQLHLDHRWYAGTLDNRQPVWCTSEEVLQNVRAKDIHDAQLLVVERCYCLSHSALSEQGSLNVFLP